MDLLNDYELVAGIFLPLLISILVREQWSKSTKTWVSLVIVLAASAGYVFYSGDWNVKDIGGTILKIFVIAVTTYKLFWKPSGVTDSLEFGVGLRNK